MQIMTMIAFCLLLLSVVSSIRGNQMKFNFHIREGKARFLEKIQTDLETNTVRFDIPAHNNILGSQKFQDFSSNLGKNDISSADSVVITEKYYIDEEITNTVSLGTGLKNFLKEFSFPLFVEKRVPEDADIQKIHSSTGLRFKRRYVFFNELDCNGLEPVPKFGMDAGKTCNYLLLCKHVIIKNGQTVFGDCKDTHINSPMIYRCMACPGVKDLNTCRANKRCHCMKLKY